MKMGKGQEWRGNDRKARRENDVLCMLYPQTSDDIVPTDYVTSSHSMYNSVR